MDSILNPTRKNRLRPRRISADAAILSVDDGKFEFTGVVGEKLTGVQTDKCARRCIGGPLVASAINPAMARDFG